MADARVGVVVRTKNRAWFLRRALFDIRAQTFDSVLVAVVNDGGDPTQVETVVAELPPDARPAIIEHNESARGRSAAANQGVRALETEFIVVHDDDDLWDPEFLAKTVAHLDAHPEDIGVVARTEIVGERREGQGFVEIDRAPFWSDMTEITLTDLLERNRAVPIAYLYRRVLHDVVGPYDEDLHAVEDWDLHLRTIVTHRIGFLDPGRPLAFWMHRRDESGELGNSMYALQSEHDRFDRRVRDEALRAYVRAQGLGLPLWLTAYIKAEVNRQLKAVPPSFGDRAWGRIRRWFPRR